MRLNITIVWLSRLTFRADYLPVYYQGCKDATAIESGVLGLGLATVAPAAIVAGVIVNRTGRYRPQMWVGWCIIMIGLGLYSSLRVHHSRGTAVGFSALLCVGVGYVALCLTLRLAPS